MKRLKFGILLLITVPFISGCENSNIFSWTHAQGKDKSPEALLVDAEKALIDGDYEDAIRYYEEILANDPDNAEALYGLAAAELKAAGLSIEDILPNIINQDTEGMSDLISGISFANLEQGSAAAVEYLEKIATGQGDGSIPADDIDVNLNLAMAKAVHAASKLINDNNVEIKDDFSIQGTVTTGKDEAIQEIESAIAYLDKAASSAGVNIEEIKGGFEDFKANLLSM